MGQKINPHGFRVGVIQDWDSRWFAKDELVGDLVVEDYNIRKYLKNMLYSAGVPKIEIERKDAKTHIIIFCARPGQIIGRGGAEMEKIRTSVEKMIGKSVTLNIVEVKSPDLNAQLVAENVAAQLEKRISFRRAMKQSMGRAMRFGAKGIKAMVSGRLGGAEIARVEQYHDGTIPLQTIRADIDYGFAEAKTTYGRIGVKIWIYKGEVLSGSPRQHRLDEEKKNAEERKARNERRNNRPDHKGGFRNDNRTGGRPGQGGSYNRPRQGQGAPRREGGAV